MFYFLRSFAIVVNCESAASKSSTMEFAGAVDMDGKPGEVKKREFLNQLRCDDIERKHWRYLRGIRLLARPEFAGSEE
jgi:hypothetical protein